MLERHQVVIIAGEGRKQLTDEEWKHFQEQLSNGEIEVTSYMEDMNKLFEKMSLTNVEELEEMESFKEGNHSWKKSNKHNHPAFKRK